MSESGTIATVVSTLSGAMVGAIISVLSESIRHRLFKPKIVIQPRNNFNNNPAPLFANGNSAGHAVYYHLRISNKKPKNACRDTSVLLTGIEYNNKNKWEKTDFVGCFPFIWAGLPEESRYSPLTLGARAIGLDIASLKVAPDNPKPPNLELSNRTSELLQALPNGFLPNTRYRLILQFVSASYVRDKIFIIELEWDGSSPGLDFSGKPLSIRLLDTHNQPVDKIEIN